MKSTQRQVNVAWLRRRLASEGVLQKDIAVAAGVTKFMVCHVLAGRAKSANVIGHARRLLAEAQASRRSPVAPAVESKAS